jgi:periplasmic divalent cation tolerance protein
MTDKIVVLNTCGSGEEAERLARSLVDRRLAACVTVISPARSFYRWKGAVADSVEWLLVIKTSRPLFAQLRTALESMHSFELPEIIALPVTEGSADYLSWMDGELQSADISSIWMELLSTQTRGTALRGRNICAVTVSR